MTSSFQRSPGSKDRAFEDTNFTSLQRRAHSKSTPSVGPPLASPSTSTISGWSKESPTTNLADGDDLAVRLLDPLELLQEVPEPRLCDDLIRGKDAHPVQLGYRDDLGRVVPTDDLILLEL